MSQPNKPLVKSCSVCGLQKPLSAFLQLSDKGGLTYGHICGHCRLTGKGQIEEIPPDDGMHTEELSLKLDIKEKIQADIERELRHEEQEVLDQEERDKKEEKKHLRKDLIKKKAGQERKHREGFLQQRVASAPAKSPIKQGDLAKLNKVEAKKGKIDYQFQTGDNMRQGFQVKYTGEIFQRFKAHTGNPMGFEKQGAKAEKSRSQLFGQLGKWLGKQTDFVKNVKQLGLDVSSEKITPTSKPRSK